MGECNKCTLASIRSRAKEYKQKVTLLSDSGKLGGTIVYVHPRSMTLQQVKNMTKAQHDRYFAAWFMAVGLFCECD